MAKVIALTEQFRKFVSELKESFWGDLPGQVQRGMCRFFELLSRRQRDRYLVSPQHKPAEAACELWQWLSRARLLSPPWHPWCAHPRGARGDFCPRC